MNVHMSVCTVPAILVRVLTKFEFSAQIFAKYSNIKFHENPSPVGAELYSMLDG